MLRLGGQGCAKEPEIAKSFAETVKKYPQTIYTYCGSCAGNLTRNGCKQVRHVLPEILGTKEKPDTIKSLINRMRTKVSIETRENKRKQRKRRTRGGNKKTKQMAQ